MKSHNSMVPRPKINTIRTPTDSQHHAIVGMNGSGKTYAAVHALSLRSYPTKPWLIYNFKNDELINEIPNATHIDLTEYPGKKDKGIYVVHSAPGDYDGIDAHFMQSYERENVGTFIDETYMVAKPGWFSTPFRYLLTQGRSKRLPLIILAQRPSWVDPFVFTEASFIQLFDLTTTKDWSTVNGHIRGGEKLDFESLPVYHSYYYDAHAKKNDPNKLVTMRPAPDKQSILDTFDRRNPERKRRFWFL